MVWIRYDGAGDKMQVPIHRIQADECPWLDLLTDADQASSGESSQTGEKPINP